MVQTYWLTCLFFVISVSARAALAPRGYPYLNLRGTGLTKQPPYPASSGFHGSGTGTGTAFSTFPTGKYPTSAKSGIPTSSKPSSYAPPLSTGKTVKPSGSVKPSYPTGSGTAISSLPTGKFPTSTKNVNSTPSIYSSLTPPLSTGKTLKPSGSVKPSYPSGTGTAVSSFPTGKYPTSIKSTKPTSSKPSSYAPPLSTGKSVKPSGSVKLSYSTGVTGTGKSYTPSGTVKPPYPSGTGKSLSSSGTGKPPYPSGTGKSLSSSGTGKPPYPSGTGKSQSSSGSGRPPYPSGTGKSLSSSGTVKPPYPSGTGKSSSTGKRNYPTGTGTAYSTLTSASSIASTTSSPPTTTSSTLPPAKPSTFQLKINGTSSSGDTLAGYGQIQTNSDGDDLIFIATDASAASTFHLNSDHTFQFGNEFAAIRQPIPPEGGYYTDLLFKTQAIINGGGWVESVCSIDEYGYLGCQTFQSGVFFTCDGNVEVGPTGRPYEDFCYDLSLLTVAV